MMNADLAYVKTQIDKKVVKGRVLELGSGYGGSTCGPLFRNTELSYFTTDLPGCPSKVDFQIDFLNPSQYQTEHGFDSILILIVLEHVFDLVMLLDNATSLLAEEGIVVLLTPVCWQIHRYPVDCNRLLPDFYREYSRRRKLEIIPDTFVYVNCATPIPIECTSNESLPRIQSNSIGRRLVSRAIHKIFRTDGRQLYTLPSAQEAIAVCMKKV